MAGSITETQLYDSRFTSTQINRHALAWVSDASGNVNGTPTTAAIRGTILKVEFKPDTGGTQPTNAYDVTLTDTAGVDVLAGQGANLSNSTATAVVPGVPFTDGTTTAVAPCVVAEALTLNVSNAGNAKGGQVILYVR